MSQGYLTKYNLLPYAIYMDSRHGPNFEKYFKCQALKIQALKTYQNKITIFDKHLFTKYTYVSRLDNRI